MGEIVYFVTKSRKLEFCGPRNVFTLGLKIVEGQGKTFGRGADTIFHHTT